MSNEQMWQIFNDSNKHREQHGLRKLECNYDLHSYTQYHAGYMANKNVLSHDNFRTYSANMNMKAENCAMDHAVENIANQWYKSPGHFTNVMGNYKEMNIGLVYKNGYYYACQVFK